MDEISFILGVKKTLRTSVHGSRGPFVSVPCFRIFHVILLPKREYNGGARVVFNRHSYYDIGIVP
ncbi:hypothetical protein SAMN05518683_11578 [Salibacterium halotolerans]|uniref:Uncharacterized protein n=1 Tax=Salibacterium halotolerans TaxID=1884432 RepID=A0A1I5V9B7_9BACI|nr:hypothetical protein SAMN05518683_11578 [Salibacterium halotolerans]